MILPDHVKEKIADPVERKRHGPTLTEAQAKTGLALEREEHKRFLGYLERNKYGYCHSRTDKRTTANVGVADFLIPCYRLAIEFKRRGQELSLEQEQWRRRHEDRGGVYRVVEVYQQAIEIIEWAMNL